ncbi:hypothetical protein CMO84_10375 [Candidatus Woesearchaeota archaeon]|nr:hypothetical protein [Candidatus Woesearchaeota archaeon]
MNLPPDQPSDTPDAPASRPGLRWTQKLGLLGVGLVGSLALTEVGLRLAGIEFHLHPVSLEFGYPDPQVMEDYFAPHPDYLWVRKGYDKKLENARAAEPYLVFSGCSCTAWGRFAQPLARRVRKAQGTRPLQFANMACSGWSSYSGLQQLQQDVLGLKPKVLTIYFGWNDHWVGYGVNDKTAGELASSTILNNQGLRVVQMLTRGLVARKRASADDGKRPVRVSLPDFRANIGAMVDLALENGIEPVLITAPTAHREGEEPEYLRGRWIENLEELVPLHQSYVEVVREVAAERNVVLCDLALLFEQMPREKMVSLLMEDGIHFTPEGGERVGALLFRCLQENELLPMADGSGPKRRTR